MPDFGAPPYAWFMLRTARTIVAGFYYHVLNRGNNRTTVFSNPDEFESFQRLMERSQARHWGSLRWRLEKHPAFVLAPLPVSLPVNWLEFVNAPQTPRRAR